jgi:hypothetical protein
VSFHPSILRRKEKESLLIPVLKLRPLDPFQRGFIGQIILLRRSAVKKSDGRNRVRIRGGKHGDGVRIKQLDSDPVSFVIAKRFGLTSKRFRLISARFAFTPKRVWLTRTRIELTYWRFDPTPSRVRLTCSHGSRLDFREVPYLLVPLFALLPPRFASCCMVG